MQQMVVCIVFLVLMLVVTPAKAQFGLKNKKKRNQEQEAPLTGFEKAQRDHVTGSNRRPGRRQQQQQQPDMAAALSMAQSMGLDPSALGDPAEMQQAIEQLMSDPDIMNQVNTMIEGMGGQEGLAKMMEGMGGEEGLAKMMEGMDLSTMMKDMGLGNLGDKDLSSLMEGMEGFDAGAMQEAMDELGGVEGMMKTMKDESGKFMDEMDSWTKEQLSEFLETMGPYVGEEKVAEWKKSPQKMRRDMEESMNQMNQMMDDEETLEAIKTATDEIVSLFTNPEKMEAALADIVKEIEDWDSGDLSDNSKIESARQKLLTGGARGVENIPSLRSVFDDSDMQEMLNDKKKFRDNIKKRQIGRRGGVADSL